LVVGEVGGRTYAFIDFERIGGVMAYDITDPATPQFVQYINNRDAEPVLRGKELLGSDLEPEGMLFIAAEDSPIGVALLAVAHERSDSTALFRIEERPGGQGSSMASVGDMPSGLAPTTAPLAEATAALLHESDAAV
jgi:hypothetical protein